MTYYTVLISSVFIPSHSVSEDPFKTSTPALRSLVTLTLRFCATRNSWKDQIAPPVLASCKLIPFSVIIIFVLIRRALH